MPPDFLVYYLSHDVLLFSQLLQDRPFTTFDLDWFLWSYPFSNLDLAFASQLTRTASHFTRTASHFICSLRRFRFEADFLLCFSQILHAFFFLVLFLDMWELWLLKFVYFLRIKAKLLVDYLVLQRVVVLVSVDELFLEGVDKRSLVFMCCFWQIILFFRQAFGHITRFSGLTLRPSLWSLGYYEPVIGQLVLSICEAAGILRAMSCRIVIWLFYLSVEDGRIFNWRTRNNFGLELGWGFPTLFGWNA